MEIKIIVTAKVSTETIMRALSLRCNDLIEHPGKVAMSCADGAQLAIMFENNTFTVREAF